MARAPEVWLRGPVAGVPPLLQPVAHAILQAREEIDSLVADLPAPILWTRPAGLASAGFHLQHITGVLDRLATYARDEPLNETQRAFLAAEGATRADNMRDTSALVAALHHQVDRVLEQLRNTPESSLGEVRHVGRARLPSTVMGLLFHAAEHTQRHVGQLLVTIRVQAAPS